MSDYNSRNDIPWAEDARDLCMDGKEVAVAGSGMVAADGTKGELTAAGVYTAGAGLGFAVSGEEPLAAGADILSAGFLNPYTQNSAALAAGTAAEHYTNEHWGGLCDGVADGINGAADGMLAVSNYMEQVPAPNYADGKLGYDPATQSAPTFELEPAAADHSQAIDSSTPSSGWAMWGTSTDAPSIWSEPAATEAPASGSWGSEHSTGSFWGGEPTVDVLSPSTGSLFGSSSESSSSSGWGGGWGGGSSGDSDSSSHSSWGGSGWGDSGSSSNSSWGSGWGDSGSSSNSSWGGSGWGDSGSSSHTDWGSSSGFGSGSTSHDSGASHDSGTGSTSMDGGL